MSSLGAFAACALDLFGWVERDLSHLRKPGEKRTYTGQPGIYRRWTAPSYTKYVGSIEASNTATNEDDELDALELVADQTDSPEDLIADREFSACFAEAVDSLDPKAQVIIRMLGAGNSFAQIAEAMGVSRSAISQKMNTIQTTLAAALMI